MCQWSGVEIMTASMSRRASISRKSPVAAQSRFPYCSFHERLAFLQARRVDVTDGEHPGVGHGQVPVQVPFPLIAHADETHGNAITRGLGPHDARTHDNRRRGHTQPRPDKASSRYPHDSFVIAVTVADFIYFT
jgi:hypothetical protein